MSEKISKQVQYAIDGIMRNDTTMTSVDLSCELFDFDIVCRDWMILIFVVLGCCDCCLYCGMGMGCDCVACAAAEPAPSSVNPVGDAGAAAFAAALEKNSSLQTLDLGGELL